MENEQLNDDAILAGDDFEASSYSEDDAILGEIQQAPPEPQPEQPPETITAPTPEALPQVPQQQDDRQAYAWSVINQKLKDAEAERDRLRQEHEQAQQQVDAGLLGDEELGYINQQLEQRDQFYQGQLARMQAQQSLQTAAFHAETNKEALGFGWSDALDLARQEGMRQAPILGISPEQFFNAIDGSPDAGSRILALAQMAKERQAASQPVDWEKRVKDAEAKAYQKALTDFQTRAAASPHNLAPPGIGAIPAVHVAPTKVMTDDEILAQ